MAACGAQCDEKKVDEPKRLFNYKPSGIKAPEYTFHNTKKFESLEAFVDEGREIMAKMMEPVEKMPFIVEALGKTVTTELVMKKGKISDADFTVYMHRPKNLPEKGCAAMIFVHGGGAISGRAKQFTGSYAMMAIQYGVVGFIVDYRLAPENGNKGCTDVYATLKYVYENAEKLGIDKTRIGMEGQSAGAHHVLNACNLMAQNGETGMCKMIITEVGMFTSVLFSSEKDWKNEELEVGPNLHFQHKALVGDEYKKCIENKDEMLFPELVHEDKLKLYPPMALFSAEFCPFHKANKRLSQRLERVGKLLEFRLIRGLGHMYAGAHNNEANAAFMDRITCVNTYLKK